MFKKLSLFIVLLATFLAGPALAGDRDTNWGKDRGKALTDTVVWKATSLPGSKVRVDTLVAGTIYDTTLVYEYSGVQDMSLMILARAKNDDLDLTVYPYVSPDGYNAWSPLTAVTDMDSATPGREDIADDTVLQPLILRYTGVADSVAAVVGVLNYQNPLGVDFRKLVTNRWIRFVVDPQMSSGDTVYLTGILTRIYPP